MEGTAGHGPFVELRGFRVIGKKRAGETDPYVEATMMVKVGDQVEHTAATGNGPVNALDQALRKSLERFYPELAEVSLMNQLSVHCVVSIQKPDRTDSRQGDDESSGTTWKALSSKNLKAQEVQYRLC